MDCILGSWLEYFGVLKGDSVDMFDSEEKAREGGRESDHIHISSDHTVTTWGGVQSGRRNCVEISKVFCYFFLDCSLIFLILILKTTRQQSDTLSFPSPTDVSGITRI